MPCSASTTSFLQALPKCEHHMHIEGSMEPHLVFQLAEKNKISLPAEDYTSIAALEERYKNFTSLDDFLGFYNRAMDVLITESDFSLLAEEYMKKAHDHGVVHAEIFFDPQAHTERGIPLSTVAQGLTAGLKLAATQYNMTHLLIMCFVRHLPVSSSLTAVEDIIPYIKNGMVKGLGMDSTEIGNPPEKFVEVYKRGQELGIEYLTAHAGEEGPAESVKFVVENMGINRIDHGIHSADSPSVLSYLASRNTFLTLCPLSNVALRCVTSVSELPIPLFLNHSPPIKFSINSDDPAYFGGYILDNYVAVQEAFGLKKSVWEGLMKDSVEGSWCERERKDEILGLLEGVMKKWEGKELE